MPTCGVNPLTSHDKAKPGHSPGFLLSQSAARRMMSNHPALARDILVPRSAPAVIDPDRGDDGEREQTGRESEPRPLHPDIAHGLLRRVLGRLAIAVLAFVGVLEGGRVRHGDDVVAGVDEMDVAGDAG